MNKNKDENNEKLKKIILMIYNVKEKYKICSFSSIYGFNNPLLWGYYANGFKGIAIEIDIKKDEVSPIQYVSGILPIIIEEIKIGDDKYILNILTRKLKKWQHEKEFRFLKKLDNKEQKIGIITNVYFGDPYSNLTNSREIEEKEPIKNYNDNKEKLKDYLDNNPESRHGNEKIGHNDVKICINNNRIYVGTK